MPDVHGGQKRVSGTLDLELQMVVATTTWELCLMEGCLPGGGLKTVPLGSGWETGLLENTGEEEELLLHKGLIKGSHICAV